MTANEFDRLLAERLDKTEQVLAAKAGEYASDADRLANFKMGAAVSGKTREEVLEGYLLKHWVSVMELVRKKARGHFVPREVIDEKVGDAINYLILLEALFLDG